MVNGIGSRRCPRELLSRVSSSRDLLAGLVRATSSGFEWPGWVRCDGDVVRCGGVMTAQRWAWQRLGGEGWEWGRGEK